MKQVIYAALLAVLCGSSVENTSAIAAGAGYREPERKTIAEIIEVRDHIPYYREAYKDHHPGDRVLPVGSDEELLFVALHEKGYDLTTHYSTLDGGNITDLAKHMRELLATLPSSFEGADFRAQLVSLKRARLSYIQQWHSKALNGSDESIGITGERHQKRTDKAKGAREAALLMTGYINNMSDIVGNVRNILQQVNLAREAGGVAPFSPDEIIRSISDGVMHLADLRATLLSYDVELNRKMDAAGDGKTRRVLEEQKQAIAGLGELINVVLNNIVQRIQAQFSDSASMGIAYMYVSNMIAGNAWRLDNNDIQIAETNSADIIVNGKTLVDRLNDWTVRHGGEALTTPDFLSQNEKTKSDKIRAFQDRLTDIMARDFKL